MKKLILFLLLYGLLFSQDVVLLIKGVESRNIKKILLEEKDMVIAIYKNFENKEKVFKKLLGISYSEYKLYRFQISLEEDAFPLFEVNDKELVKLLKKHKKVVAVLPSKIFFKIKKDLKKLRGVEVIKE